jgi:hypothetical protein
MTPPVRVVCVRCAGRYALVVDPACPLCGGRGTVAVVVGDQAQPWVAARALGLHIGDYWVGSCLSKLEGARQLPLVTDDDGSARGLDDGPTDTAQRAAIGRAAVAWLVQVGLRKRKQRKSPKPRKTAAQRAEEQRQRAAWPAAPQQRRQDRQEEAKRQRIEAAALDSLRAAHPEEFEEMVEREGPLLAMGEMWWA